MATDQESPTVDGDVSADDLYEPSADGGTARRTPLPGGAWLVGALARRLRAPGAPVGSDVSAGDLAACSHRSAAIVAAVEGRLRIVQTIGQTDAGTSAATVAVASPTVTVDLDRGSDVARERATFVYARHALRRKGPLAPGRVLVTDADDLRETGFEVSTLSWERTAWQVADIVSRAPRPPGFEWIVVAVGMEGAVVCRLGPIVEAHLVFDPEHLEGAWRRLHVGTVWGTGAALTAGLAVTVGHTLDVATLKAGIERGLWAARALLAAGYRREGEGLGLPDLEGPSLVLSERRVPLGRPGLQPEDWRLTEPVARSGRVVAAEGIVREGTSRWEAPRPKFGKLLTIDRTEIEGLAAARDAIAEFLTNPSPKRPLCLAVFGPPGAGKSFGVREVAAAVGGDRVVTLTVNLAQRSRDDLVAAFHLVRDHVLRGRIPLVLLDEFDTDDLAWLGELLAPMQDGEFAERGVDHPLGKAILVFAGGTCATYRQFAERASRRPDQKGPDFISRLRGHVDIQGPNPLHADDHAFVFRRAVLLRSLLERDGRLPVRPNAPITIDRDLLRALLLVPRYRHGARSMEAVLDMCAIAGARRWQPCALPADPQLDMHVDVEAFRWLLRPDVPIADHGFDLLAAAIARCDLQTRDDCASFVAYVNGLKGPWALRPGAAADGTPPWTPFLSDEDANGFAEQALAAWKGRPSEETASPWDRLRPPGPQTLLRLARDCGLVLESQRADVCMPAGYDLDALARRLHERYAGAHGDRGWADLRPDLQHSNRDAARHAVRVLREDGLRLDGTEPRPGADERLMRYAQREHSRFVWERVWQGWSWAPRTDRRRFQNVTLVPWDLLPDSERKKDDDHWSTVLGYLVGIGALRSSDGGGAA